MVGTRKAKSDPTVGVGGMRYGRTARVMVVEIDGDPETNRGVYWQVVIDTRKHQYTLDVEFDTPGQAVDAAERWARVRGLKLAVSGVQMDILRMPPR